METWGKVFWAGGSTCDELEAGKNLECGCKGARREWKKSGSWVRLEKQTEARLCSVFRFQDGVDITREVLDESISQGRK